MHVQHIPAHQFRLDPGTERVSGGSLRCGSSGHLTMTTPLKSLIYNNMIVVIEIVL